MKFTIKRLRGEFTCENCGQTFKRGWSNAEAEKEYDKNFSFEKELGVERAIVCDDCYYILLRENGHEASKRN
jgi:hypothetical protein